MTALFILCLSTAYAAPSLYLATQLGYHHTDIEMPTLTDTLKFKDNGPTYGLGLGLNFSDEYRLELSWLGRSLMSDNILDYRDEYGIPSPQHSYLKISTNIFLLNAYKDICLGEKNMFYIGAGAGVLHWKTKAFNVFSQDGNEFTTALHTGVTFSIGKEAALDIGLSWYHAFMGSDAYVNDIDNIIPHIGLRVNL